MNNLHDRVVITGLGAISPLGLTVDQLWGNLAAGRSGVARITQFDASVLPCQIAGEVKGFEPRHYLDAKDARRMSRCAQFVMAATQEAMNDAGLGARLADPGRAAVVLGTGIGGVEKIGEALEVQLPSVWAGKTPAWCWGSSRISLLSSPPAAR